MRRVASALESVSLPDFLAALEHRGELTDSDVLVSRARIARLRQAWLNLDRYAELNTCYIRTLTLYRFLNPREGLLRIHFGVNPGEDPEDRIHGHAWVTWNGQVLEAPDAVLSGVVTELYAYPERLES
jgi:hypothetical protein